MTNDKLIVTLKILLANTQLAIYKSQVYHWNCEGKRFNQVHNFFQGIYEELFVSMDSLAEHIRIQGEYTPISISDLSIFSTVSEDKIKLTSDIEMYKSYSETNQRIIDSIQKIISVIKEDPSGEYEDVLDFAISRLGIHKKTDWMLKSLLKVDNEKEIKHAEHHS
jgi:starvation-inducible DNA-binding protein